MKKLLVGVLMATLALGAVARNGAWVDEIVMTEVVQLGEGVAKLAAGDLDVYAFSITDRNLFNQVRANPGLKYYSSFGSYNDLTFNNGGAGGAFFSDGRLNPFGVAAIREAMNWLIDRDYIANEIMGGLAIPKYTLINSAFPDAERHRDLIEAIEDYYAYDFAKAEAVVTAEMEKLGAVKVDGKWMYNGKPVEIIGLIRSEDERTGIGNYFCDQLEKLGFATVRRIARSADLAPLWQRTNPEEGKFSFYTGGWVGGIVDRDVGDNFDQFYSNRVMPYAQWVQAPWPEDLLTYSDRLARKDYTTMDERAALLEQMVWATMKFSNMIWVVDRTGFNPVVADLFLAADVAGGIYYSTEVGLTIQYQKDGVPVEGGTVRLAMPTLLQQPWNPLNGSNFVYDMFPIRVTSDTGVATDTRDGLFWPKRIEKAEITVLKGLPVAATLPWVTLNFVDKIEVPGDAWVDWDAANQRFITVAEKYPNGLPEEMAPKRYSRVYYPADMFQTVKLHDGSPISVADFVMGMILTFDQGKPESAIYDEVMVPELEQTLRSFCGVKIVSTDPLIIDYYSTIWYLDAEWAVADWWPYYSQGPGFWHVLAVSILAEANKELAMSEAKADLLGVEWTNLIAGPSLSILAKYLDEAIATTYIPYAPTLGQYITAAEAQARYANLKKWYEEKGHFWVADGPFYLEKAYTTEKIIVLKRFEDHPDPAGRFDFLLQPKQ